jgi:hypothetical protein
MQPTTTEYSDLIHEAHPVDRYPVCWPADWEETIGFREFRATRDENQITCPACLTIINNYKERQ